MEATNSRVRFGGDTQEVAGDSAVLDMETKDGQELEAAEEEPAERVHVLPTPFQPTHSQYCDHCVTHFPYQSWCPHCVEGRGREFGHQHRTKEPGRGSSHLV